MNHLVNYGYEYVVHCHLLAHEEMDMMHSIGIAGAPVAPSNLSAKVSGTRAALTWKDNSLNETSFTIQRSVSATFATVAFTYKVGANTSKFTDPNVLKVGVKTYYRILASDRVGDNSLANFPTITADSAFSAVASVTRLK